MSNQTPRFSLVLATVHRTTTLDRFFTSLAAQSYRDYELILVDQNSDDRLGPLIDRWSPTVPCLRIHSAPGLSKARNAGIALARGAILAFPDDDCWYPNDLLENVNRWLETHKEYPLLCISARGEDGAEVASRWPRHSCPINRRSVLRTCTSFCLFLRRTALAEAGGFDEAMGLGTDTPFQSSEDLDVALRIVRCHGNGWFEKSLFAYHPHKDAVNESSKRAFNYGAGFGYLLRKHHYGLGLWLYHLLRAFSGAAVSLMQMNTRAARFYWMSTLGRITGYCTAFRTGQHT